MQLSYWKGWRTYPRCRRNMIVKVRSGGCRHKGTSVTTSFARGPVPAKRYGSQASIENQEGLTWKQLTLQQRIRTRADELWKQDGSLEGGADEQLLAGFDRNLGGAPQGKRRISGMGCRSAG